MGMVRAVCLSAEKGTAKQNIGQAELIENHGLKGDAHAGNWHRQVSLLSFEKIEAFRARGSDVAFGGFGENIVVAGIDLAVLPVGTQLRTGGAEDSPDGVLLEITQIGKECHSHCAVYNRVGDCIMPREGVFVRVLRGGIIKIGDEIYVD